MISLDDGNGDEAHTCTEEWLDIVERGGLTRVNETTFQALFSNFRNLNFIFIHNTLQTSRQKSARKFLQMKMLLFIGWCCQVTGKRVKAKHCLNLL